MFLARPNQAHAWLARKVSPATGTRAPRLRVSASGRADGASPEPTTRHFPARPAGRGRSRPCRRRYPGLVARDPDPGGQRIDARVAAELPVRPLALPADLHQLG